MRWLSSDKAVRSMIGIWLKARSFFTRLTNWKPFIPGIRELIGAERIALAEAPCQVDARRASGLRADAVLPVVCLLYTSIGRLGGEYDTRYFLNDHLGSVRAIVNPVSYTHLTVTKEAQARGDRFTYAFPAHSFTLIRIPVVTD